MEKFDHTPILLPEILKLLRLTPGMTVIDATLGLGGHARAMADAIGPQGTLIAFEWDARNRVIAEKRLAEYSCIRFVSSGFSSIKAGCEKEQIFSADAILFDLGISSAHLDDPERGFSYRFDAPLDMRMDQSAPTTASDLLNRLPEEEIANMIYRYGEERRSRRIAEEIMKQRKLKSLRTTSDLMDVIEKTCPGHAKKSASRVFQALRIAVNGELEELQKALPQACELLKPGGRIAVITFHSLEDRIVKNFFRSIEVERREGKKAWQRINKKVIIPGDQELRINPRSRSAKLRVLEALFL